jgi:2-polyprenyl-3-methyl-5-hydroxy-6-metoxy-1,4-benzoquinol methylase
LSHTAARLYPQKGVRRTMQVLRPYICPFHRLMDIVPQGSRVLDVGCGAGLFLGLLAASGRIESGRGFDANADAINAARTMASSNGYSERLHFESITVNQPWPAGSFDVISLVDVMHHVPADQREALITNVSSHLKPGGLFIYKDMVRKPLWRAWANKLHDFVVSGERIQYAPLEDVVAWLTRKNFVRLHSELINMYWYGHELCVFEKKL